MAVVDMIDFSKIKIFQNKMSMMVIIIVNNLKKLINPLSL